MHTFSRKVRKCAVCQESVIYGQEVDRSPNVLANQKFAQSLLFTPFL